MLNWDRGAVIRQKLSIKKEHDRVRPKRVKIAQKSFGFLGSIRAIYFISFMKGRARTQCPTITNYTPESPTFGEIARVNQACVQWQGLALGERPCRSTFTPVPGKYA